MKYEDPSIQVIELDIEHIVTELSNQLEEDNQGDDTESGWGHFSDRSLLQSNL